MLAAKWQIAVVWEMSKVGLNGGLGLNPSSPSCADSAENGRAAQGEGTEVGKKFAARSKEKR